MSTPLERSHALMADLAIAQENLAGVEDERETILNMLREASNFLLDFADLAQPDETPNYDEFMGFMERLEAFLKLYDPPTPEGK